MRVPKLVYANKCKSISSNFKIFFLPMSSFLFLSTIDKKKKREMQQQNHILLMMAIKIFRGSIIKINMSVNNETA